MLHLCGWSYLRIVALSNSNTPVSSSAVLTAYPTASSTSLCADILRSVLRNSLHLILQILYALFYHLFCNILNPLGVIPLNTMESLMDLSNELLFKIGYRLNKASDLNALCQVTRHAHELFNRRLYRSSRKLGKAKLQFAGLLGRVDIVQRSLEYGVDLRTGAPRDPVPSDEFWLDPIFNYLPLRADKWGCQWDLLIDNGQTALAMAANYSHLDLAEYLLCHGLDPNRCAEGTYEGVCRKPPLMWAVRARNLPMVKLLLDHEAATDSRANDLYSTLLNEAARNDELHICRLLIDHGADVNEVRPSLYTETAVQASARHEAIGVLRLLLEHGADPDLRAADDLTALQWAHRNQDWVAIDMLLRYGANIHLPLPSWDSPRRLTELKLDITILQLPKPSHSE